MIDLLFSRYGSGAKEVLQLEFETGMELIATSQREVTEEKLYQRWICGYQISMSFEEFKRKIGVVRQLKETDHKSVDEILSEVKEIVDLGKMSHGDI